LNFADPVMLSDLRRDMLRFARLQLRDAELAEDAVQEAMASAFTNMEKFNGKASVKTWVFSILRNKIVDLLRRGDRAQTFSALLGDDFSDDALDSLFQENGRWQPSQRPSAWAAPEEAATNKAFWVVFQACLDHLPEAVARVFMMREMLDLETSEICARLDITNNNCHVILHRARASLRSCLEKNWFAAGESPSC
jgi:RNA polymerase sigma-70 factor, ECF subfamily